MNTAELIERAKNALSILGLSDDGEWARALRLLISYEDDQETLANYPDWCADMERVCGKIEFREGERQRQAFVSKHLGQIDERRDFVARIELVLKIEPKPGEEEREFGDRYLTKLADDEGNVLIYWNQIHVADPTEAEPKRKRDAIKGERISFSASVKRHSERDGVKQTQLQRVTKAKLA